MVIIGSYALNFIFGFYKMKSIKYNDIDIICKEEELKNFDKNLTFEPNKTSLKFKNYELHNYDHLNNADIYNYYYEKGFGVQLEKSQFRICSMKGLYILKRSHLHRIINFEKHMIHFHKYIKPDTEELNVKDKLTLKVRTKQTKEFYKDTTPSLKKTNDDFFNDSVSNRHFIHDDIHEAVAFYKKPIYTKLKYEGEEDDAFCQKELWEKLEFDDKVKCVQEEALVLSLERFIIPSILDNHESKIAHKLAYLNAVKKICTQTCGGYFRDFAIDNYPRITDYPKQQHIKFFNTLGKELVND